MPVLKEVMAWHVEDICQSGREGGRNECREQGAMWGSCILLPPPCVPRGNLLGDVTPADSHRVP